MYTIGGKEFSSKDQIAFVCKSILGVAEPGCILDALNSAILFDVLLMHPRADEKIGVGVQAFGVQRNPQFGKKEFVIYRTDGTFTEFSYLKCLKSRTNKTDFTQACRQAVSGGIIAFHHQYFKQVINPLCALTGIILTPNNSHVDHIYPQTFSSLVERFMKSHKVDIDAVELVSGGDNSCTVQLKDKQLEKAWIEYHWKYAKLRVISASANLALGNKPTDEPQPWYHSEALETARVKWRAELEAMGYVRVGAAEAAARGGGA